MHLQDYLAAASMLMVVVGRDEKVDYINRYGCELLECEPHQAIGLNWFDVFMPESVREARRAYFRAIMNGEEPMPIGTDIPILTFSGQERLVSWRGTILRDANGQATGVLSSGRDITDSVRIERELRESRDALAALIEAAPVAIAVVDRERRLTLWNPAAEAMFGYTAAEVLGGPSPAIPPERQAEFDANYRQLFERSRGVTMESQRRHKDGHIVDVTLSTVALRDAFGEVTGAVGIMIDRTEQHRAETLARRTGRRLDLVVDQIPAVLWTTDRDLIITSVAGAGLQRLGIDEPSLLGRAALDLAANRDRVAPAMHAALAGSPAEYESVFHDRVLQTHVEPLRDDDGQIVGTIALSTDITERAESEAALRESTAQLHALSQRLLQVQEEERMRISREVHDELGQQITALRLDVARMKRRGAGTLSEDMESLLQQLGNLQTSVRRLAHQLRPSTLDHLGLTSTIEQTVREFEGSTGIPTRLEVPAEEISITADVATAAFRILQEALTNIARHANATHVEVSIRVEGERLLLSVRDDGIGVPATGPGDRASLGIIGMRERAESFGGTLVVQGRAGEGTTVTATLPLRRER
ncbi:MAG TPA: PAS domain S-box protein [Thermoanaerobaculia bacterium]|nr:PAS domain S-box protein [Thermoanaerobaculia bacterium]